ncbi:MAG: 5-formyltetrahydrofolate cyclo-ligase [Dinoroseobacter sp.]|nr:5-formyltetrahydrofolate cyclo-ligase [Dinoroseobacter sp.]
MVVSKAEARARAKERRKLAFESDRRLGGPALEAATDRLLALIDTMPDGAVSGYMPIHSEIDPRPAMTALHWAGRPVCVPVVEGKGKPLHFHRWTPEAETIKGPFGAQVPADPDPVTPRILVAPMLAFDARGTRLGYGGGFYDRTLSRLRAADPATRAVGFAFAAQEAKSLPAEQTDARLDALVTEAETLLWPSTSM